MIKSNEQFQCHNSLSKPFPVCHESQRPCRSTSRLLSCDPGRPLYCSRRPAMFWSPCPWEGIVCCLVAQHELCFAIRAVLPPLVIIAKVLSFPKTSAIPWACFLDISMSRLILSADSEHIKALYSCHSIASIQQSNLTRFEGNLPVSCCPASPRLAAGTAADA